MKDIRLLDIGSSRKAESSSVMLGIIGQIVILASVLLLTLYLVFQEENTTVSLQSELDDVANTIEALSSIEADGWFTHQTQDVYDLELTQESVRFDGISRPIVMAVPIIEGEQKNSVVFLQYFDEISLGRCDAKVQIVTDQTFGEGEEVNLAVEVVEYTRGAILFYEEKNEFVCDMIRTFASRGIFVNAIQGEENKLVIGSGRDVDRFLEEVAT